MTRIPAKLLTPALRDALDAFLRRVRPKGFAGVGPVTPGERAVADRIVKYELLGVLNGVLIGAGVADIVSTLISGSRSPLYGAGLLLAGGALYLLYRRFMPHGSSPSREFLAGALPSLQISPAERRYAEALVAAGSENGDRLELLRHLVEEEARLDALAASLGEDDRPAILSERDSLRQRLEASEDRSTRETLAQSLSLIERRLASAEDAAPLRERIAAHRSLLEQASHSLGDGIARRATEIPDLERAASLGAEVAALEAAVQEMRAL